MKCQVIKGCDDKVVVRVRLFETDGSTTDLESCQIHVEMLAGEYPDNIKQLVDYERNE